MEGVANIHKAVRKMQSEQGFQAEQPELWTSLLQKKKDGFKMAATTIKLWTHTHTNTVWKLENRREQDKGWT